MIFKQIKLGPMRNFSYIIGDEKSKEAAAVDSGWDIDKLADFAVKNNLNINKIILTHSHYDHVQKTDELAAKTNAVVYCHELDFPEIRKSVKNSDVVFVKLNHGDEIKIGKIKIKIIHTPGHTKGSMCLLFENKIITGDTLFVNAIGRTDLDGGDSIKLFESLQMIKKLGDDIEVYPGHDYGEIPFSTIGAEKKNNPYFMCNSKEQFLDFLIK